MKSSLYTSLFAGMPVAAIVLVPPAQQILTPPALHMVKFPGHNSAYYTQMDPSQQLFGVRELVIYPNPPRLNEHIFLYLDGWNTEFLPDIADAKLKISGTCPDYWEQKPVRITDAHRLIVRHDDEYGGPLRSLENNELLIDWTALWWSPREEKWNCSAEGTARLPDKRILFSFAQNFTLQYPPFVNDEDERIVVPHMPPIE